MQPTSLPSPRTSNSGCGSTPRRPVRTFGSTATTLPNPLGSWAASSMERTRPNGSRNSGAESESLRTTHRPNNYSSTFDRRRKITNCGTLAEVPASKTKASFIEPMLLLRTEKLPDDLSQWHYELKWDGFRAIAVKTLGKVHLRSRNDKDFNGKYPTIVKALAGMPDETVIDGEVVGLDESGHPSF